LVARGQPQVRGGCRRRVARPPVRHPYAGDDDGASCANAHFNASRDFGLEIADLDAILVAANASRVVDCIVNVPAGSAAAATAALEKAFGGAARAPCLTVLETKGEDPQFNSSISCVAAVPETMVAARRGRAPPRATTATQRRVAGRHGVPQRRGVFQRRGAPGPAPAAAIRTAVAPGAHGTYWVTAEALPGANPGANNPAAAPAFWAAIGAALAATAGARGDTLSCADLVDCTLFLPPSLSQRGVAAVQRSAANASSGGGGGSHGGRSRGSAAAVVAAQLTLAQVSLGGGAAAKVRCTALVGGAQAKRVHRPEQLGRRAGTGASVVVAGGFAYVSGVGSALANATDALHEIGRALNAAGSRLDLVLNCLFWVASTPGGIGPVFAGFYDAFNCQLEGNKNTTGTSFKQCAVFQPAAGYPPPSRTEFVGAAVASQCLSGKEGSLSCPALAKCVAAMPAD
jgi:hypothetical protein